MKVILEMDGWTKVINVSGIDQAYREGVLVRVHPPVRKFVDFSGDPNKEIAFTDARYMHDGHTFYNEMPVFKLVAPR